MEIQVNWGHGQPLEWHTCRVGPKQWWGRSLMRSSGLMREWLSLGNTWRSPRLHVCGCILFVLSCVFSQVITWHYFTKKIATVSIRCSPRLLELKRWSVKQLLILFSHNGPDLFAQEPWQGSIHDLITTTAHAQVKPLWTPQVRVHCPHTMTSVPGGSCWWTPALVSGHH